MRPDGHAGALSSATASSATRGACPCQVERQEVLVAGLRHLAAVRGRIGAHLGLVVAHRHGARGRRRTRSAPARRARPRWRRTACRTRTAWKPACADRHARARRAGPRRRRAAPRACPRAAPRTGRARRALVGSPGAGGSGASAAPRRGRAGLRHRERALERGLGVAPLGAARRREAPGAADAHAHADALGLVAVELVERAVARRQALALGVHEARIGVVRPRRGGIHQEPARGHAPAHEPTLRLRSRHVPEHSNALQLRASRDRRGGARGGPPVRAQDQRVHASPRRPTPRRSTPPSTRSPTHLARLLDSLVTTAPPKDREVEAAKARARSAQRYAA